MTRHVLVMANTLGRKRESKGQEGVGEGGGE